MVREGSMQRFYKKTKAQINGTCFGCDSYSVDDGCTAKFNKHVECNDAKVIFKEIKPKKVLWDSEYTSCKDCYFYKKNCFKIGVECTTGDNEYYFKLED